MIEDGRHRGRDAYARWVDPQSGFDMAGTLVHVELGRLHHLAEVKCIRGDVL